MLYDARGRRLRRSIGYLPELREEREHTPEVNLVSSDWMQLEADDEDEDMTPYEELEKQTAEAPAAAPVVHVPKPVSEMTRDLAGYVHTPAGFIKPADYKRIVRENPDAGLPEYEAIPRLK